MVCAEVLAGITYGDDFRMGRGIAIAGYLVVSLTDDLTMAYDDSTEGSSVGLCRTGGQRNRLLQKILMGVFALHLASGNRKLLVEVGNFQYLFDVVRAVHQLDFDRGKVFIQ